MKNPVPRPELVSSCEKLRIAFPEELPITRHIDEIKEAWRNNQPNLLLHQRMVYTKPEDYAQEVIDLGGQMGIVEA